MVCFKFSTQMLLFIAIFLFSGEHYTFDAENKTHANSAVEVIFQTGVEDTNENMLNELKNALQKRDIVSPHKCITLRT